MTESVFVEDSGRALDRAARPQGPRRSRWPSTTSGPATRRSATSAVPGRHRQDRPDVRRRPRPRPDQPPHRQRDRRAGPRPRMTIVAEGVEPPSSTRSPGPGLRRLPGLPLLPAAAARGPGGISARRRRRRSGCLGKRHGVGTFISSRLARTPSGAGCPAKLPCLGHRRRRPLALAESGQPLGEGDQVVARVDRSRSQTMASRACPTDSASLPCTSWRSAWVPASTVPVLASRCACCTAAAISSSTRSSGRSARLHGAEQDPRVQREGVHPGRAATPDVRHEGAGGVRRLGEPALRAQRLGQRPQGGSVGRFVAQPVARPRLGRLCVAGGQAAARGHRAPAGDLGA